MRIWEDCRGTEHIGPLRGTLYRLVESQEQIATLGYVDTLEEQALLEEMLEQAKPPYRDGTEELHYLLKSPFRYPPLRWGSRFGQVHEPAIFYGGCSIPTTLAESAYYRFLFWFSIDAPPIRKRIHSAHTLFSVGYRSEKGVRLHRPPFNRCRPELTHPVRYQACQLLGTDMRAAGVEAFEYTSARDVEGGRCVGLFHPAALATNKPRGTSQWLCELSAEEVSFRQLSTNRITSIAIDQFLVDGELPLPA